MKRILAVLALTGALYGCHAASAPLPQGALNTFDADSYASLMVAEASLNSFKTSSVVASSPTGKKALNQAITDYNVGEAAWQAYHAGGGNSAAVTAALATIATDILNLSGILGGTK
jgi:hypothetical protein